MVQRDSAPKYISYFILKFTFGISDYLKDKGGERDHHLLIFPHNFYPLFKKAQDQYQVDVIEAASGGDNREEQVNW